LEREVQALKSLLNHKHDSRSNQDSLESV